MLLRDVIVYKEDFVSSFGILSMAKSRYLEEMGFEVGCLLSVLFLRKLLYNILYRNI